MGVFSKDSAPGANVKRNSFDLSFQNNLTMSFGTLYPAMCKEVLPGDTFDMDMAFGLRFMPMPFPIQTKMRCDAHFFYVRSRTLWDGFQDFICGRDDKGTMPMIDPDLIKSQFKTGSLADYLGLPTTIVTKNSIDTGSLDSLFVSSGSYGIYCLNPAQNPTEYVFTHDKPASSTSYNQVTAESGVYFNQTNMNLIGTDAFKQINKGVTLRFRFDAGFNVPANASKFVAFLVDGNVNSISGFSGCYLEEIDRYAYADFTYTGDKPFVPSSVRLLIVPINAFTARTTADIYNFKTLYSSSSPNIVFASLITNGIINDAGNYYSGLQINALPFRAYEAIYNSFYRDQRNNPYQIDGVDCPNEYIPTKKGGYDSNNYVLHQRNWEQDFLTTALPSPQMGIAPLVGISSSGVASYASEDGTTYKVHLTTADDGDTVTGAKVQSSVPNDVARSIINTATSGISINDFRAVNSLQRWLEANYRKGIKYRDQLEAHFGVTPSYSELDMPEFLGGCSEFVNISQINQTSESSADSPLGSFAGQASAMGASQHKIHRYFDEHGYVFCIISVVPVPCYSQLLPKHFLKLNTLDYYFPEFGHIGFQPIPYSEVCPLQANFDGSVQINDVFGYQRPWYDYLSSTDEVHGEFRSTLRDFVLYRLYEKVPSLNEDFLLVNNSQLNNVFSVNDTSDKILGQIHFRIHAKRPIPRYGIPRLE